MNAYQMIVVMRDGTMIELCAVGFHSAHSSAEWAIEVTGGSYYANVKRVR